MKTPAQWWRVATTGNNPIKKPNKHFDDGDRAFIDAGLRAGKTIRDIADALSHDRTTVSREVRKHAVTSRNWMHYSPNLCGMRADCAVRGLCLKPSLVGMRQPMLYEKVNVMRK